MRRLPTRSPLALLATVALSAIALAGAPAMRAPATALGAQVVHRPVPFDSAGRVMSVTPSLATRLGLASSTWPVAGDYVEARLYAQQPGAWVLIVERPGGVLELYALSDDQRQALSQAISTAVLTAGRPSTDARIDVVSEPAGRSFVRDQTLLAAISYGPAMATLTGNAAAGTAAYLLTVGTTFFVATRYSRTSTITRAQNHLAWALGWKGALLGLGTAYVAGGEDLDPKGFALGALAGSVAGSALGFRIGRPLTDGEAHAASFGSTALGGFTAGLLIAANAYEGPDEPRAAVAGTMAATLLGFPLGLAYPRRVPYRVTAGDVGAMWASAAVGALGAASLGFAGDADEARERRVAGLAAAGGALGILAGDRLLVRRYEHTTAEGWLVRIGALAGGLIGAAIPVAAEADGQAIAIGGAVGGAAGIALTEVIVAPARRGEIRDADASRGFGAAPPAPRGTDRRLTFSPASLALAAARMPGRHSLLQLQF